MQIPGPGRKTVYAAVLIGYYTFILSFSMQMGFTDLIVSSILVGALSYGWFLLMAARFGTMVTTFTDLVVNIVIFTFIVSFVVSFAFWLSIYSNQQFTLLKLVLSLIPVVLWDAIWVDFYFQRVKGRM